MRGLVSRFLPKGRKVSLTVKNPDSVSTVEGYIPPQNADALLRDDRRQLLLDQIWEQTSLSKEMFQTLYLKPIRRYAERVQLLPASENHHHAYLGGMLDHGLELIVNSLRLRQTYMLPIGAAPEDQAIQADAWSAGTAYGGLLHDIGKIAVDITVERQDGTTWYPWLGVLDQPYRFRYIKGRDYKLHNAAAGLVYGQILDPTLLSWLSRYQELWGSLLYLLAGHYDQAGALGEIVSKADRQSTAKNIGANPDKVLNTPVSSLQKHLLHGLKHLLNNELKLNQKGAAGWLTQAGLFLVSKAVSDKLRAYLLSQGFDGIPTRNSALFDELQSHGIIEPNAEGNAIWKALIEDGDWKQEFTFLKVKPSLIWGNDEFPPAFDGTLTVLAENTDASGTESTGITESIPQEKPVLMQSASEISPDLHHHECTVPAFTPKNTPKNTPNLSIDGVLSLLGEDITENSDQNNEEPTSSVQNLVKAVEHPETNSKKETGTLFLIWLKERLRTHKLALNDTNAKVHIVDGYVFLVTPGIFQRYCGEYVDMDNDAWRTVQRGFEKLKLHKKLSNDLNIWSCIVKGPRKQGTVIRGYLLEAGEFFESPPMDNPFLTLKEAAPQKELNDPA